MTKKRVEVTPEQKCAYARLMLEEVIVINRCNHEYTPLCPILFSIGHSVYIQLNCSYRLITH